MLRDITLGQYIPGDTVIHRLDPRCKIILTILYIAIIFCVTSPVWYVIPLAYLLVASRPVGPVGQAAAQVRQAAAFSADPDLLAQPVFLHRYHGMGAVGVPAYHAGRVPDCRCISACAWCSWWQAHRC